MRPDVMCMQLMLNRAPVTCTRVDTLPVIVLGGTRNARDLLYDLDVRRCQYAKGRVHCGMLLRTRRLWGDTVKAFVSSCGGEDVHIVGWSLGGGCAVHMAAIIHSHGMSVPKTVTTLGAPKCGDASFARWYARVGLAARTTRYETLRDPVVNLPTGSTYHHVGRRVVLTPPDGGSRSLWGQHELQLYYNELLKQS